MVRAKLYQAAQELQETILNKGFSTRFILQGSSMNGFLQQDDLVILKRPSDKLRLFDIIAYYCQGDLVLHRIISRKKQSGSFIYTARGDNNLNADNMQISSEQIYGRLNRIQRGSCMLDMSRTYIYIYSLLKMFCSRICVLVRHLFSKLNSFYKLVFLLETDVHLLDWSFYRKYFSSIKYFEEMALLADKLKDYIAADEKFAEIDLGLGFSEISLILMRKKKSVSILDYPFKEDLEECSVMIISDLYNFIDTRQERIKLLKDIYGQLSSQGILVMCGQISSFFSWNSVFRTIKWKIYKFLNFRVPEPGLRFFNNMAIKTFEKTELVDEITESGFKVKYIKKNEKRIDLICRKI